MATLKVGSARSDEKGKYVNGAVGDQTGAEVSTQNYYLHSKGWYLLRPKEVNVANAIAEAMQQACDNANIGYDQGNRLGVIEQLKTYGTMAKIAVKTECDCSSLVRGCCIQAGIKDPGNFTTANEASKLIATGAFEDKVSVKSTTTLYNGDILVTKTKGHTVVVVSGRARAVKSIDEIAKEVIDGKWGNGDARKSKLEAAGYNYDEVRTRVNELLKGTTTSTTTTTAYYPKYTGSSTKLDTILKTIGVPSQYIGHYTKRKPIATANGISNYTGSVTQNAKLIALAKTGKLKKV